MKILVNEQKVNLQYSMNYKPQLGIANLINPKWMEDFETATKKLKLCPQSSPRLPFTYLSTTRIYLYPIEGCAASQ